MTNKQQVDTFLELYRRLEAAADIYLPKEQKSVGVISRLTRYPKFMPYREELDTIREARNLLTHEVRVDGEPAIVPSDGSIRFLQKMIRLLEDPLRVRDRMTWREKLLTVSSDEAVLPILEQMKEKGLSRIPLLSPDGCVEGMLSVDTIFLATIAGVNIDENTLVSELAPYLGLDNEFATSYRFVPAHMLLETAEDLFHKTGDKRTKLRALLVTENGSRTLPLLGILSPYDVLNPETDRKTKRPLSTSK